MKGIATNPNTFLRKFAEISVFNLFKEFQMLKLLLNP